MIDQIANLMRWEWFKLRRRWMPWILLAVLVLFSQLFLWASFLSYRTDSPDAGRDVIIGFDSTQGGAIRVTCRDVLSGNTAGLPSDFTPADVERMRQDCQRMAEQQAGQARGNRAAFTLPTSVTDAMTMAQSVGLILVIILTASSVGTEYGWGTLRMVLARGPARRDFLVAKLALMAVAVGVALAAVVAFTAVSSLIASSLVPGDAALVNSGGWADAAKAFGKVWFALLPYVALAGLVSVITASTAAGMGASLGYYFVEQIASAILMNFFDWFETVADFLLGRNVTAWMLAGQGDGLGGATSGMGIRFGEYPGGVHAFLVLAVYIAALVGLALWVFRRRDVAGGGGG